jgi:hypothetical protein
MHENNAVHFYGLPMYGWGALAVLVIVVGVWAILNKKKR